MGVGVGGMLDFPDGSFNGVNRKIKPWSNTDPKAEFRFNKDAYNWTKTWIDDYGLIVESIKVIAL